MKKLVLFPLLVFMFFLAGNVPQAKAAYVYESVAFYGQSSPSSYVSEGTAFYAYPTQADGTLPIYRFRNTNSGDHFYTISENEKKSIEDNPQWGYIYENIAFYASPSQTSDTLPLYRFSSTITGDHLYTISENEKKTVLNNPQWGYVYEKIAFYVHKTQVDGTLPVYRFSNVSNGDHFYTISQEEKNKISLAPVYRFANTINGNHFYTISITEKNSLINNPQWGYKTEGVAFYEYTSQVNGTLPVYRFSNTKNGDHFYTISESERKSISDNPQWNYIFEGIAFYANPSQTAETSPVYRFNNATNGDHFYTISVTEKNALQKSELGPEISVGLWSYSKSDIQSSPFKLTANRNYVIKDSNGTVIGNVSGSSVTRVTYDSDSNLKVYNSIASTKSKKVVYFEAADGDNAGMIFDVNRPDSSYDQYRGRIKVQYNTTDGNIWTINILPLEHYVWGMGETTGTGPAEHTKVMTAIFRTYGQWYIDYATKYAPYGFKIRSDSGSQIYRGYDWETKYPNIKTNAKVTRGVIATYGSETALTPYSSWSDGRTRSYKERWGSSDYPWCKSVSDPYGKNSSMTTSQLEAAGNHMVGLIANGSLNLADDHGWDYQRIMKYYYTGISLNTNY
jgi:peptidoglycan hydrolase-like amidase